MIDIERRTNQVLRDIKATNPRVILGNLRVIYSQSTPQLLESVHRCHAGALFAYVIGDTLSYDVSIQQSSYGYDAKNKIEQKRDDLYVSGLTEAGVIDFISQQSWVSGGGIIGPTKKELKKYRKEMKKKGDNQFPLWLFIAGVLLNAWPLYLAIAVGVFIGTIFS